MFAALTTPSVALQTDVTASSSRPSTTSIAPSPSGTAACIARPRRWTKRTASVNDSAPAQHKAEYSPRLWPAMAAGLGPPCARQRSQSATLAVRIAGCVSSVRFSVASGPELTSSQSGWLIASPASSKRSLIAAFALAWSASMPTAWEPCPGKTIASVTVFRSSYALVAMLAATHASISMAACRIAAAKPPASAAP